MSSRRPIDEPTIPLALCTDLAPERVDVPTPTLDMVRHLRAAAALPDDSRYAIEGPLGVGGMGEVLAVHDTRMRRTVAMKTLKEGFTEHDEIAARFFREAQITAQLEHPNVVPVHDLGVDARGKLFYTMKRVHGESLAVVGRGDMSRVRRLQLFLQVCDAIAYAHAQGFVHRDLKPANVMIGDFGEVLVLDWGVAKRLKPVSDGAEGGASPLPQRLPPDSGSAAASGGAAGSRDTAVPIADDVDGDLTQANAVLGTPTWMAPEQALGEPAAPAADQYALGAILYFLLVGEPAFKPGSDVIERVVNGTFRPPRAVRTDVPPELEAVVLQAMQREPGDRYADVPALREDVQAWLEGRPVQAYRYRWTERVAKAAARNRRPLVAAVSVAVVAAIVLATVIVVATRRHVRALEAEEARTAAAQQDATRQLADREVSLALLHADLGLDASARADLQRALGVYADLGEPVSLRARFARAWVEHRRPSPVLTWDASAHPVTRIWSDPEGDELVMAADDGTISRVSTRDGRTLGTVHLDGDVLWGDVAWFRDAGGATGVQVAWQGRTAEGAAWRARTARWEASGLVRGVDLGAASERAVGTVMLRGGRVFLAGDPAIQAYDVSTGTAVGPVLTGGYLEAMSEDGRRYGGRTRGSGSQLRAAVDYGVWDTATGLPLRVQPVNANLAFSRDGRQLLEIGERAISLVDLDTGGTLWTRPEVVDTATFGLRGLSTRLGNRNEARDLTTGAVTRARELAAEGMSSGGAVFAGDRWMVLGGDHPRLYALDAPVDHDLDPTHAPAFGVTISPDGVLLAVPGGLTDGGVRLFDARTGRLVRALVSNSGEGLPGTRDCAFSPDGRRIAAADRDGHVRVWSLSGALLADHAPGHGIAVGVDWRGGTLAAAFEDGTVLLVSDDGAQVAQTLAGAGAGGPLHAAGDIGLSPDAAQVVVSGRGTDDPVYARWEVATGKVLSAGATGHGAGFGVTWAADTLLVATDTHGTWRVPTGGPPAEPLALPNEGINIANTVGPHGMILTASVLGVHVWDAATLPAPGAAPAHPMETMLAEDDIARAVAFGGERLFLASQAPRIWRVDFDPPAPVEVALGTTTSDALRDVRLAAAFARYRRWDEALALYTRWPDQAPVIDQAAVLLAAGRHAEAVALREKLLAAGVSAGTLEVWLGE